LLLPIACLTKIFLRTILVNIIQKDAMYIPLADVYITESKLPAAEIAIMTSQAC
jgi:hypothetical protein